MKGGFVVRELKFEDFNDLIKTYFTYYDELKVNPDLGLTLFKEKPDLKDEVGWFASTYKDMLEGNKIVLVAEVGGKAIGICDVTRFRPGTVADHKGVLGIAISRNHRAKGIGSALINEAIKRSRGKFEQIILSAYASNKVAVGLYKKFGFKEYGTLPRSIKRGRKYTDETFMYLELK